MPTTREALLDAARLALDGRAWAEVRMAEVAAGARVSRQTLYNEFGGKAGLARALERRESDRFVAGFERALDDARRRGADPADCFAAATAWTLSATRRSPLARAALTGFRGERLPPAMGTGGLAAALRDRAAALLGAEVAWVCEAAVRLTVSYVIEPADSDQDACHRVARLVRTLTTATS
jgi:AcrR family transcriptional regulator